MNNQLYKFVIRLLKFSLVSAIIYIVLTVFWYKFIPKHYRGNIMNKRAYTGHTFSRLKQVKTTKNVDVLFLGTSHTYRGFDNRIFAKENISSFNLGSSAQTPMQTKVLLTRYLDSLNPKLVVYGAYAHSFTSDGVEPSIDLISNDIIDFELLKVIIRQNNLYLYNSLIYAAFNHIDNSLDDFSEDKIKKKDTYVDGGFVERKMEFFKYKKIKNKRTWNFRNIQFEYFEDIIEMLNSREINFVIVNVPISKAYYNSFKNNDKFDDKMKSYGKYYDFNKLINLDDSLNFYDRHHLNQRGVEKFNKELISIFKKDSLF